MSLSTFWMSDSSTVILEETLDPPTIATRGRWGFCITPSRNFSSCITRCALGVNLMPHHIFAYSTSSWQDSCVLLVHQYHYYRMAIMQEGGASKPSSLKIYRDLCDAIAWLHTIESFQGMKGRWKRVWKGSLLKMNLLHEEASHIWFEIVSHAFCGGMCPVSASKCIIHIQIRWCRKLQPKQEWDLFKPVA